MDHVRELRGRLLWCAAVFAVGAVAGYLLRGPIITFLQRPLHQTLYYTTPMGSFEFVMQVCAVVGLMAALPMVVFHLLRFLEPALPKRLSAGLLATVVTLSFGLAVSGAAFAYCVSLPAALHFFGSVGASHLRPLISIDQYARFVFAYLATFAVVFQLPLLLLLLDHITPLGPKALRKWRKLVVVAAFAIALITPSAPDPLSQLILALPIILLYEVSLAAVWLRARARQARPPLTAPPAKPSAAAPSRRRAAPSGVIDLRSASRPSRLYPGIDPSHLLDLRSPQS